MLCNVLSSAPAIGVFNVGRAVIVLGRPSQYIPSSCRAISLCTPIKLSRRVHLAAICSRVESAIVPFTVYIIPPHFLKVCCSFGGPPLRGISDRRFLTSPFRGGRTRDHPLGGPPSGGPPFGGPPSGGPLLSGDHLPGGAPSLLRGEPSACPLGTPISILNCICQQGTGIRKSFGSKDLKNLRILVDTWVHRDTPRIDPPISRRF